MEKALSAVAGTIRQMEPRDIDAVMDIQTQSREAAQWSRTDYEALARGAEPCFVAKDGARVVGFLMARKLADEMEILNLAVHPAARRQRFASRLLHQAMDWDANNKIGKVHLEVRASNAAARAFYERHGFRATGIRANYYRDPDEDAVLLTAAMTNK
ncbi:MAG: ribosomal protein S18-alanine N-acetyltransferase [Candidatus Acidiferrales bacterium]